jgi:hypothetical protein
MKSTKFNKKSYSTEIIINLKLFFQLIVYALIINLICNFNCLDLIVNQTITIKFYHIN